MFKEIFKILTKIIILLLFVTMFIMYFSKVYIPDREDKDNDTKSRVLGFYELERNSLDILFLGSSHIYYGINPSIIYKNTGLNSYLFAGECQPIEVTYYFLKEALKTQSPKLVVLDVFSQSESINVCKNNNIYRVNLENLNYSFDKFEAYNKLLNPNVLDISLYHNRWKDVDIDSYFLNSKYFKDFGYTYGKNFSYDIVNIDSENMEDSVKPENIKFSYLEKIVNLCKQHNINIMFIKTPYYINNADKSIYKFIDEYSKLNNINFINFNSIKNEIGYKFNIHGDVWHSNIYGAKIVSEYLANFINDNYTIYPSKDIYKDDYIKMNDKLNNIIYSREYNLDNILKFIENDKYTLLLNYNYFDNSLIKPNEIKILSKIGYNFDEHPKEKMIIKVKDGKRVEEYYSDEYFYKEFVINNFTYKVEANGYVSKDGIGLNIANNYACISVVNEYNGEFIDNFCLDTEGGLYMHRDMLEE